MDRSQSSNLCACLCHRQGCCDGTPEARERIHQGAGNFVFDKASRAAASHKNVGLERNEEAVSILCVLQGAVGLLHAVPRPPGKAWCVCCSSVIRCMLYQHQLQLMESNCQLALLTWILSNTHKHNCDLRPAPCILRALNLALELLLTTPSPYCLSPACLLRTLLSITIQFQATSCRALIFNDPGRSQ